MRMLTGAVLAVLMAGGAQANDTAAQLGTGGLTFVRSDNIEMVSEDLYISSEEIRVKYEFRNNGDADEKVLVAFPMPDIEGRVDFIASVPTDDPENFFGFSTTFAGKVVSAQLHQYAFAAGIEQTQYLRDHDIPLAPQTLASHEAINGLDDATRQEMRRLGLVQPIEYDDGTGLKVDFIPIWLLRSTYSWVAVFPAGEIVEVEHRYKPSVGGTLGATFLRDRDEDPDRLAEYRQKYCLEDDIVNTIKSSAITEDGWTRYPFFENWISYIWSTGDNWAGTVGRFTLTIDKGAPENLISFCGENVKKIGPTTFQITATDWVPPWDRELEILLLVRQDN